jgi:hypothetical protein
MTVYGRSDITFVEVSGAGHSHAKKKNEANMAVTCIVCEPELEKMGWSRDPRKIELTPDEIAELEDAQNDIARFEALRIAEDARQAADAIRGAGTMPRTRGTAR